MKRFLLLTLFAIIGICSLLMFGCSSRNDFMTEWRNIDYDVDLYANAYSSEIQENTGTIIVSSLKKRIKKVTLYIDGELQQPIQTTSDGGITYNFDLKIDQTYYIDVNIDGNKCKGEIKIPHQATLKPFNLNNNRTISWTINKNSQYQTIILATKNDKGDLPYRSLTPDHRKYTIPSKHDFVCLLNINYRRSQNIIITSVDIANQDNQKSTSEMTIQERKTIIRNLYKYLP
jgi:hypothetical protein